MGRRQHTKSKAVKLKYRKTHERGWLAKLRKDLRKKARRSDG